MSHTKEPWGHVDSRVYFPNIAGGFDLRACPNPEDNARRIVACVNACAGVGTETLELMAKHHAEPLQHSAESNLQRIAALEAKVRELEAERDELLDLRKLLDDVKQGTMADERIKFVHNLITDLTASRQQVERLVEALTTEAGELNLIRACLDGFQECIPKSEALAAVRRLKALAAVENERGNAEVTGGPLAARPVD